MISGSTHLIQHYLGCINGWKGMSTTAACSWFTTNGYS
jgi:hypothetical protein